MLRGLFYNKKKLTPNEKGINHIFPGPNGDYRNCSICHVNQASIN